MKASRTLARLPGTEPAIAALEDAAVSVAVPTHNAQAIAMLRAMPDGLRTCLLAELRRGNRLLAVDQPDWPQPGSIFVSLADVFHPSTRSLSPEVHWRDVNDPRWWREELTQVDAGVEHMVVC